MLSGFVQNATTDIMQRLARGEDSESAEGEFC